MSAWQSVFGGPDLSDLAGCHRSPGVFLGCPDLRRIEWNGVALCQPADNLEARVSKAMPLRDGAMGGFESSFVMVEWVDVGGSSADRPIAPLHVHHNGEEAWYVLEGRLGVRLGDETFTVESGCCVVAPRGTPHTFWNDGDEACRYIVVMASEIHRLIQSLHAPEQPRDRRSMADLFEQHGSTLL